jgi:DNA polymerase-4
LTCSLGVGTSKVVCKIGSDRRKPGGITVVPPGKRSATFLAPLRYACSQGRATCRGQAALGARVTIGRLPRSATRAAHAPPGSLGHCCAIGAGHRSGRDLDLEAEPVSVSAEDTFARDLTDRERLHDEVRRLPSSSRSACATPVSRAGR